MVVTFHTKAVARDMSARIGLALAKAMESTDDAALQARALNDSSICCLGSYFYIALLCQWVIRSYLHTAISSTIRQRAAMKQKWHCYNKRY